MVDVKFSWNSRVIILSVFAIVLSIIIVFVTEIKCVNKILLHINNKSIHDDLEFPQFYPQDSGSTHIHINNFLKLP